MTPSKKVPAVPIGAGRYIDAETGVGGWRAVRASQEMMRFPGFSIRQNPGSAGWDGILTKLDVFEGPRRAEFIPQRLCCIQNLQPLPRQSVRPRTATVEQLPIRPQKGPALCSVPDSLKGSLPECQSGEYK